MKVEGISGSCFKGFRESSDEPCADGAEGGRDCQKEQVWFGTF